MSEVPCEVRFRLLTQLVVLTVPDRHSGPFLEHFVTPDRQDAPERAIWTYGAQEASPGRLILLEGGDRFAEEDPADAVASLEERVVGRALDHFARWGWLVVAGRLDAGDDARRLTIGHDDGSLTLLRDGDAVPLPLPFPHPAPVADRGPLTELVVTGSPVGLLSTPAALAALVGASRAAIPGGPNATVRQAMAALHGVQTSGDG